MDFVGIDLHKTSSQICMLSEGGELTERRIKSTRAAFDEVLPIYINKARLRRTPYSASGLVVPSPTRSTIAATARSRRLGKRALSADASASGNSSKARSVQ
jgi:predicted NBD/HSP70 family sugar kinase